MDATRRSFTEVPYPTRFPRRQDGRPSPEEPTTVRATLALVLAALAAGCAGLADLNTVPVETGPAEFAAGDSVAVTEIRGSNPTIVSGGSYRVRGRWTLASRETADLAVWIKDGQCAGNTSVPIARGSGGFDLTFMMMAKGFPVLSLRIPGTGDAFGFVHFREAGGPLPEGAPRR